MTSGYLEIFQEEIPARMQRKAIETLCSRLSGLFEAEGLMNVGQGIVEGFVTPLRLIVRFEGLVSRQPDREKTHKGPLLTAPPKAIAGFLKSRGLSSVEDCARIETPKGEALLVRETLKGQPARTLLPGLLVQVMTDFPWPNSMRFADGDLLWIRPLRQVVLVFDGEAITTSPHSEVVFSDSIVLARMGERRCRAPEQFADYRAILAAEGIEIDSFAREQAITVCLEEIAKKYEIQWIEDRKLLAEVSGLSEQVQVLDGRIDPRFMTLPEPLLKLTLRTNQKYFLYAEGEAGRLSDRFALVTSQTDAKAQTTVLAGNQRVLRARLSDGAFFIAQDSKKSLIDHAEGLKQLRFVEGGGSMAEKAERIGKLLQQAMPGLEDARHLALLAKADLLSEAVSEFPELQGIMGGYYLDRQRGDPAWVSAIAGHYAPRGAGDSIPDDALGRTVALCDKLDTVACFTALDRLPKGSGDPFAVRRAMLGVLRILASEEGLPIDCLVTTALASFPGNQDKLRARLIAFAHERMVQLFRDHGIDAPIALAALESESGRMLLIGSVTRLAQALAVFLDTEAGETVRTSYFRIRNILKGQTEPEADPAPMADLEQADLALTDALGEVMTQVDDPTGLDEWQRLAALAGLSAPLDRFFDETLVHSPDKRVRAARINLLLGAVGCIQKVFNADRLISG